MADSGQRGRSWQTEPRAQGWGRMCVRPHRTGACRTVDSCGRTQSLHLTCWSRNAFTDMQSSIGGSALDKAAAMASHSACMGIRGPQAQHPLTG